MVSSASDAAVLAADACAEAGLTVPELPGPLIADPLAVLPPGARAVNPVDTTATVPGTRHGAVDAVLVTLIPIALSAATGDDPARALVPPSGTRPRPIATVLLDQDVPLQLLQGGAAAVPAYADPTSATRALAHAVSSAHRHAEPLGTAPALEDIDSEAAAALVADFLAHNPEGGWAGPQLCGALLDAYGTPQSPWEWATDADAAVAAAERVLVPAQAPYRLRPDSRLAPWLRSPAPPLRDGPFGARLRSPRRGGAEKSLLGLVLALVRRFRATPSFVPRMSQFFSSSRWCSCRWSRTRGLFPA